jgi:hypothetical protein
MPACREEAAGGCRPSHRRPHPRGYSVVRVASSDDRLTFAGDLVFAVGFERYEWYNGFEHDPEESPLSSVFCGSWRRSAASWWPLTFPSVGHVAVDAGAFR